MAFYLTRAQALCLAPERKTKTTAVLALEACLVRKTDQAAACGTCEVEGHSGVTVGEAFPKVACRNSPAHFAQMLSDLGE